MASRRLDISSLLCDDNPPAFSPLDALVHAATEERKRLDATHEPPQPRIYYEEHRRPQHHEQLEQQHAQHRAQAYDIDRHRRMQEAQRIEEQKRAQELEYQEAQYQRQKEIDRLRAQEHERRLHEEKERRMTEQYERQQRDLERQREADRLRIYEQQQRLEQQRLREEQIRENERQRQREELRELERVKLLQQERIMREHERHQRELIERQREQERIDELHRQHRPQPIIPTPHPPSISHLISHPPHRKPDPVQINHSPTPHSLPGPISPPSHDDQRPIKKRRYSESPTRPIPDDKERIARERDKMVVGELGYGRVESPIAGPSYPPRRPGSGHGHSRKPVAVSDLLVEKEPVRPHSREARVVSPLGRRSPPGSQIGRAKAARKSDEYLLREPPPFVHMPVEPEVMKVKEEPKVKQEPKSTRPRISLDELRTPVVEEPRPKKPKEVAPPPPPPPPPKVQPPKSQQEDAHEWFLQQYDEEPSPTMSTRAEQPPHTPSPSLSPVASTLPAPALSTAKTPPATHKSLTPITLAVATPTLEQELEELVSEPTTANPPSATIAKKQEPDLVDMDLDVDLAVTELVDTLEEGEDVNVKHEPVGMEVDVEDELLSLVDDRPPPPPPTAARRAPGSSGSNSNQGSAVSPSTATASVKQAPPVHRSVSEARQASPPTMLSSVGPALAVLPVSAVRQPSTRPTSERGSMPPPALTSVGATAKKGTERAESVVPSAAGPSTKKKKEPSAKAASKSKSTSASTAPAKPRAKPAAKGKKGSAAAAENATSSAAAATPAPSKASKALTGRKTAPSASRSRSASVMPASVSVGPESDVPTKAEKQEEEEESDAENEDDKLYCVCKTKYDEDRFMIACDRCDEWYHTQCVRMPDIEADLVDQFICPLCIKKNPHLNLQTTYKQRCLNGLRHPDPTSTKACHKAARGAFSKYCSDECGVKYMQSRIDTWSKKGGKSEKLWESVKNAEKREGVVVCAVEPEIELNGCKMEVDAKLEADSKEGVDVKPPVKQRIVPPKMSKIAQETERLNSLLDSVIKLREEIKRGMEVVVWRERLLQLASERAESVGQCGWDQRLCLDDEEWADMGVGVLESYEDVLKGDGGVKEEGDGADGEMEVDGVEEQWWCPGKKVCDRHAGWQTVRYKDVCKEKEKKEEALAKLTTREREIRKRIEDMLDPQNTNNLNPTTNGTGKTALVKETTSNGPLKASNAKALNGHPKSKATGGDGLKKGKKRKAPAS